MASLPRKGREHAKKPIHSTFCTDLQGVQRLYNIHLETLLQSVSLGSHAPQHCDSEKLMPKGLGLFLAEKRRGQLVIQPPEGRVRAAEAVGSPASRRILSSSGRLLIGQGAETHVLIIHPLAVFKLRSSIYSRTAKPEGPPGGQVSQAPAPHPSHHEHLFSFFSLLPPSSFPHPDSPPSVFLLPSGSANGVTRFQIGASGLLNP